MKKTILSIIMLSSISIACDGSPDCKAQLKECKNEFKNHITTLFKCVEEAKSKKAVTECQKKLEDKIEDKCEEKKD